MVTYNPKEWFKLIFQFHKSDTFRILFPTMLLLGFFTAAISFVHQKYYNFEVPSLTIFHQISGFIISLVLVFRINTAYDRWWEGRKLWGSLLNVSRTLALKLNAMVAQSDTGIRNEFAALISNYAHVLKEHLRNNPDQAEIEFVKSIDRDEYQNTFHKPNLIASKLTNSILSQCKKSPNTHNDFMILVKNVDEFTDICGGCERIKNTPIPYAYSLFIKKIIFIYIITMPFTFGMSIGYWAVPIVITMFYAFASLELISEEIEDPFGTDSNDLPTDEIAAKIKKNVYEILTGHGKAAV